MIVHVWGLDIWIAVSDSVLLEESHNIITSFAVDVVVKFLGDVSTVFDIIICTFASSLHVLLMIFVSAHVILIFAVLACKMAAFYPDMSFKCQLIHGRLK